MGQEREKRGGQETACSKLERDLELLRRPGREGSEVGGGAM